MKAVFIGAGSGFGGRISVDILSRKPLEDSTIALCDINEKNLKATHEYVQKVIDSNNLPAKVISSTDRRELLPGADFVNIAVSIGGPAYYGEPFESEMNIPMKYGIMQTVGDTVSPGGLFRALRTAPVLLEMVRDINELAPNAIILNLTNPMAILTWAMIEVSTSPVIGLCHGVMFDAKKRFLKMIGLPPEEISLFWGGINHMTWFLKYEHKGKDILPLVHQKLIEELHTDKNRYHFRAEMLEILGHYCTESDRHFPEYVPWFQHEDQDKMLPFRNQTMNAIKKKRQHWYEDMGVSVEQAESVELIRSNEASSGIMEAYVTDTPWVFSANVMNDCLIDNLPRECCVEVPCTVDRNGFYPHRVGKLPVECAAMCQTNINMQSIAVEAIRQRSREMAFHALMFDPITMAKLSLKKTRQMFDEMWEAEAHLLEYYK